MFGLAPQSNLRFRVKGHTFTCDIHDGFRPEYAKIKHQLIANFESNQPYAKETEQLLVVLFGEGAPAIIAGLFPKPTNVLGALIPWTIKKLEPRLRAISSYSVREYARYK